MYGLSYARMSQGYNFIQAFRILCFNEPEAFLLCLQLFCVLLFFLHFSVVNQASLCPKSSSQMILVTWFLLFIVKMLTSNSEQSAT